MDILVSEKLKILIWDKSLKILYDNQNKDYFECYLKLLGD